MPSSTPVDSIDGLSAAAILLASDLADYRHAMAFFYGELVNLNVNLYIVDRVIAFPIDALTEHINDKKIFFGQVVDNFLDASLLIVTKLAADVDSQTYTLLQLKNSIKHATRPEFRIAVRRRLKAANFDTSTRQLLEEARQLRNNRVAHFNRAYVLGQRGPELVGQVKDVKTLCGELNRLYSTLMFDVEPIMLPQSYEDGEADIDEFLDAYARSSPLLRLPEDEPQAWEHARFRINQEDIDGINHYRAKLFHLPPIS